MKQADIFIGLILGWFSLSCAFLLFWLGYRWWQKRKYGAAINHSLLLVQFGQLLTKVANQNALAQLLNNELPDKFGIHRSLLLLPKDYQLLSTNDDDIKLPINHTAVRWVASAGDAQLTSNKRLGELIKQGRTNLSWTRVWIPLMRGAHMTGMWLLGERDYGASYSHEDLQWFTSIAREAAAILEAMNFTEQERKATSEMRALYRQMITVREDEWNRLSRELHDGVLQDLCAITRDLKSARNKHEDEESFYNSLITLSGDTVTALRAICNDLRPPLLVQDTASALTALVEDMDARSPAPIHIEMNFQEDELRLTDEIALTIFRITQEALNNALRHADASEITVRLTEYPSLLRLTIADDGQGIHGNLDSASFVAGNHFGIAGMLERAAMVGAKLDIQTSLGYGTVVIFELPL